MKNSVLILSLMFSLSAFAQNKRMLSTYTIQTKVKSDCASVISLTLFEEGTGHDSLNRLLIQEILGHYMQSKPIQKLEYFYNQRIFEHDSSFDFSISSASTYSNNDLYSFTICPQYACNKEETNTYETEMATLDAKTGRILDLKDFFDLAAKKDTLERFIYKIVTMYRIRSLPICKITGYNPNIISAANGVSTPTDIITYELGLSNKYYISDDRFHLYNRVKHRDYDYADVEIAIPFSKLKYFLKPEMALRLGIL